jgi:hypothetical protein
MASVPGWPTLPFTSTVLPLPSNTPWEIGALLPEQVDVEYGVLQEEATQDPSIQDVEELFPFDTASFSLPVMAPRDGYTATFGSYLWAPLTVVRLEYESRYFNVTRRV